MDTIAASTPNIMSINSQSALICNENNFYDDDLSLYVDFEHQNEEDKLTLWVYGKKFYCLLVKRTYNPNIRCLHNAPEYSSGHLIVAKDRMVYSKKKQKMVKVSIFTIFECYLHFFNWVENIPIEERNYYEVIPTGIQKPHFDLDIECKNEEFNLDSIASETINSVMIAIVTIFKRFNVPYNQNDHLLVFSSHSFTKRSYHLIIRGFIILIMKKLRGFIICYCQKSLYI